MLCNCSVFYEKHIPCTPSLAVDILKNKQTVRMKCISGLNSPNAIESCTQLHDSKYDS